MLNVSGSGNAPPHIMTVSSTSAQSCFFFSSRRRHTRSLRDWSSDVCSSDLYEEVVARLFTVIVCAPATAADEAEAVRTPGFDDVADCAARLPNGSFNANTADCSAFRSEVICANALLCALMLLCWFCNWVMFAWSFARADCTNAFTSIPDPNPVLELAELDPDTLDAIPSPVLSFHFQTIRALRLKLLH